MPGDRLSSSSAYHGPAEGTLHVQTLFLADSGGARGYGAASLLRLVWLAHASGEADQAPVEITVQQEHSNAVAEEGRHDRESMCGGAFQPHRGRQGGIHRGGGDLQISGTDVGPVRR